MSSKRKQFSVSECFNRKTAKTNEIQSNECDFKHKLKTLIATNVRKTGKPDRNENLGLRTGQDRNRF